MSWWWNTNTYTDGHSNGHGYSYINGPTDAYAEVRANTKTPTHTTAKTVVVFAKANIVASATSDERSVLTEFGVAACVSCRLALRSRLRTSGLAEASNG